MNRKSKRKKEKKKKENGIWEATPWPGCGVEDGVIFSTDISQKWQTVNVIKSTCDAHVAPSFSFSRNSRQYIFRYLCTSHLILILKPHFQTARVVRSLPQPDDLEPSENSPHPPGKHKLVNMRWLSPLAPRDAWSGGGGFKWLVHYSRESVMLLWQPETSGYHSNMISLRWDKYLKISLLPSLYDAIG